MTQRTAQSWLDQKLKPVFETYHREMAGFLAGLLFAGVLLLLNLGARQILKPEKVFEDTASNYINLRPNVTFDIGTQNQVLAESTQILRQTPPRAPEPGSLQKGATGILDSEPETKAAAGVKDSGPTPNGAGVQTPGVDQLVDLNRASSAELQVLSGIGPVYAERIIQNRPYTSLEQIMRVKGIGPKTFEKIKDKIKL